MKLFTLNGHVAEFSREAGNTRFASTTPATDNVWGGFTPYPVIASSTSELGKNVRTIRISIQVPTFPINDKSAAVGYTYEGRIPKKMGPYVQATLTVTIPNMEPVTGLTPTGADPRDSAAFDHQVNNTCVCLALNALLKSVMDKHAREALLTAGVEPVIPMSDVNNGTVGTLTGDHPVCRGAFGMVPLADVDYATIS